MVEYGYNAEISKSLANWNSSKEQGVPAGLFFSLRVDPLFRRQAKQG